MGLGVRDGPDQPGWVIASFRYFALRTGLFNDVGRTISAAEPTALADARPERAI